MKVGFNDDDDDVKTCVTENSADDHHNERCKDENEVGAKHTFTLLTKSTIKGKIIDFETFIAPKQPKKATMVTMAATTMMM